VLINRRLDVLVTHPTRQHSLQLVRALLEAERLAEFWTGRPLSAGERKQLDHVSGPGGGTRPVAGQVRSFPGFLLPRLIGNRVAPPRVATVVAHDGDARFDGFSARRLRARAADAWSTVFCYENSARETFRAAKRLGMTTVLDAASVHHSAQDAWASFRESDRAHRRITRRKDEEIALADYVWVTSEMARETYLEAGVPRQKISVVPLGVEVSAFTPPPRESDSASTRFIFVGRATAVKGVDVLLDAFRRLREEEPSSRLMMVGRRPRGLTRPDGVEFGGQLTRAELARELRRADCLVLPSRFDSFGLVVPEAMATGLPVIVSDRVGAKDLVRHGETGWVFAAEDREALYQRLAWCVANRPRLLEMGRQAAASASDHDWEVYRQRVQHLLERMEAPRVSGVQLPSSA
jgi:glycosyltransferase involved in cell wall biosynthesis